MTMSKRKGRCATSTITKPDKAGMEIALRAVYERLLQEQKLETEAGNGNQTYGLKAEIIKMYKPIYPWLNRDNLDYYIKKKKEKKERGVPDSITVGTSSVVTPLTETVTLEMEIESSTEADSSSDRKSGGRSKGWLLQNGDEEGQASIC